MKTYMHHIHQCLTAITLAVAAMLCAPVYAQTSLEYDPNPGCFYLRYDQGHTKVFTEGNYWKISFSDVDTLGVKHDAPVSMGITGGLFPDTTIVMLNQVDSLLMYQPEPIARPGVLRLSREQLAYVINDDKDAQILHLDRRFLDFWELPPVDGRIVCDIFEYPLRHGFLAIVKKVEESGQEILVTYDRGGSLSDYYEKIYYTSAVEDESLRDTTVITAARARGEEPRRVRRGIIAHEYTNPFNNTELLYEIKKASWTWQRTPVNDIWRNVFAANGTDFTINLASLNFSHGKISGTLSGRYENFQHIEANDCLDGKEDRLSITYTKTQSALTPNFSVEGSFEVYLLGGGFHRYFLDNRIHVKAGGGIQFFAQGAATLSLNSLHPICYSKSHYDESQGKTVTEYALDGDLNVSNPYLSFSATAGFRIGAEIQSEFGTFKPGEKETDDPTDSDYILAVYANAWLGIIEFTGKANFFYSLADAPCDTPQELEANYAKIDTEAGYMALQSTINISAGVSFWGGEEAKDNKPTKGGSISALGFSGGLSSKAVWWNKSYLPTLDNGKSKFALQDVYDETRELRGCSFTIVPGKSGWSTPDLAFELCEYDPFYGSYYWIDMRDYIGTFSKEDGQFSNGEKESKLGYYLRKGSTYRGYPIYLDVCKTNCSPGALFEFRVPYETKVTEVLSQNHLIYFTGELDEWMNEHDTNTTHLISDVHFEYSNSDGSKTRRTPAIENWKMSTTVQQTVEFDPSFFQYRAPHKCRLAFEVDGKPMYSDYFTYKTQENPYNPITDDYEADYKNLKIKFKAHLSDAFIEKYGICPDGKIYFEFLKYYINDSGKRTHDYVKVPAHCLSDGSVYSDETDFEIGYDYEYGVMIDMNISIGGDRLGWDDENKKFSTIIFEKAEYDPKAMSCIVSTPLLCPGLFIGRSVYMKYISSNKERPQEEVVKGKLDDDNHWIFNVGGLFPETLYWVEFYLFEDEKEIYKKYPTERNFTTTRPEIKYHASYETCEFTITLGDEYSLPENLQYALNYWKGETDQDETTITTFAKENGWTGAVIFNLDKLEAHQKYSYNFAILDENENYIYNDRETHYFETEIPKIDQVTVHTAATYAELDFEMNENLQKYYDRIRAEGTGYIDAKNASNGKDIETEQTPTGIKLKGLDTNTEHHVKLVFHYTEDRSDIMEGTITFTTLAGVYTGRYSHLGYNSATLHGSWDSDAQLENFFNNAYFFYGKTQESISDELIKSWDGESPKPSQLRGIEDYKFTGRETLNGLEPSTHYYYKYAVISTDGKWFIGESKDFTTFAIPTSVMNTDECQNILDPNNPYSMFQVHLGGTLTIDNKYVSIEEEETPNDFGEMEKETFLHLKDDDSEKIGVWFLCATSPEELEALKNVSAINNSDIISGNLAIKGHFSTFTEENNRYIVSFDKSTVALLKNKKYYICSAVTIDKYQSDEDGDFEDVATTFVSCSEPIEFETVATGAGVDDGDDEFAPIRDEE